MPASATDESSVPAKTVGSGLRPELFFFWAGVARIIYKDVWTRTFSEMCFDSNFFVIFLFIRWEWDIMVDSSLITSVTLMHKAMKKSMAPNLPHIRVSDLSDMDILSDWDFENVKAFRNSIPGYRSSASMFMILQALPSHESCPSYPIAGKEV